MPAPTTPTRCACSTPAGIRAWSASSRRGSRTATTARRSCSRAGGAGEIKGSGRSIAGFHLRDALDLVDKRAPGLIAKFGGHAYAAGLSLAAADLPRFARAVRGARARAAHRPRSCSARWRPTAPSAPGELDVELAEALRDEVWGQGFPAPQFDGRFAVADQRIVGEKHSKLALVRRGARRPSASRAILFNHVDPLPPAIRAVYRPDVNEWNGNATLQLVIQHWEPA